MDYPTAELLLDPGSVSPCASLRSASFTPCAPQDPHILWTVTLYPPGFLTGRAALGFSSASSA